MLREVWLNIRVEKIDTHKGVTVKVLLDSDTTGMFMDRKITARHEFKLQKLKRPVCKKAKLQARIKPTALCSVIDKENSIESLLDLLHYIYNYYYGYASCLPQSLCLLAGFCITCYDCDL